MNIEPRCRCGRNKVANFRFCVNCDKVGVYGSGGIIFQNKWGVKYWYTGEDLHREDGPAIEYPDGDYCYCLNGKRYPNEEQYWKIVRFKGFL